MEFIQENFELIIAVLTAIVTYVCGCIAKKNPNYSNKLIPLQNIIIGLIGALVYFISTKDISAAIAIVGLGTGGAYDLKKSLKEIIEISKEE